MLARRIAPAYARRRRPRRRPSLLLKSADVGDCSWRLLHERRPAMLMRVGVSRRFCRIMSIRARRRWALLIILGRDFYFIPAPRLARYLQSFRNAADYRRHYARYAVYGIVVSVDAARMARCHAGFRLCRATKAVMTPASTWGFLMIFRSVSLYDTR